MVKAQTPGELWTAQLISLDTEHTLNTFGFSITISAASLQQYSSTHNLGTNTSLEDTEATGHCKKTAN